jgi:hypothetical protein
MSHMHSPPPSPSPSSPPPLPPDAYGMEAELGDSPDFLVAALDRLQPDIRELLQTPWGGDGWNYRTSTRRCVEALRGQGLTLEQAIEFAPFFPDSLSKLPMGRLYGWEGLLRELWAEHDIAQQRAKDAAESARVAAEAARKTLFDPWEDPPAPPWPERVLSRKAEETLAAISLRDGVDYAAQSLAYLSAASGAAPKNSRFTPYAGGDWSVPPIIWVMLIADSAQRKTAIIKNAFAELKRVNGARWVEYSKEKTDWNGMSEAEKRERGKPVEPHSFLVADITVEKLQMIMAVNPRGTMLLKDEIAAILDFGRYSGGTGAAERAFYLESYEGDSFTVHRIGRDSLYIENNALSLFGCIQPRRLQDFKGLDSDGLLQRMIPVKASAAVLTRPEVKVPDLPALHEAVERMARSQVIMNYSTTPDGSELIRHTEQESAEFATITDYGIGFQGFCGKLHGTHARLAMILHMLDEPEQAVIPTETVQRAYRLTRRYILRSAINFYATLPDSNLLLHRDIGGWLLNADKDRILASDLTNNVKGCRKLPAREISGVLDRFITGGWLEPESDFPNNRAWQMVPGVREAFSERGESERERRADIRAKIGRIVRDPE